MRPASQSGRSELSWRSWRRQFNSRRTLTLTRDNSARARLLRVLYAHLAMICPHKSSTCLYLPETRVSRVKNLSYGRCMCITPSVPGGRTRVRGCHPDQVPDEIILNRVGYEARQDAKLTANFVPNSARCECRTHFGCVSVYDLPPWRILLTLFIFYYCTQHR